MASYSFTCSLAIARKSSTTTTAEGLKRANGGRSNGIHATGQVGDDNDDEEAQNRRIKYFKFTNFIVLCLTLTSHGACSSLFAPFFPTEAAKRGVSATVVGLIFGLYTFVMFFGSMISGWLIKHAGFEYMIGAGTFLTAGSTILFGLMDMAPAGASYVAICFIIRFIEGAGSSM